MFFDHQLGEKCKEIVNNGEIFEDEEEVVAILHHKYVPMEKKEKFLHPKRRGGRRRISL